MTWLGAPPDTEAGKPTTTGPNASANTPPRSTKPPTNESPNTPQDATTAGPNTTAADTKPSEFHATQGTRNIPVTHIPEPESPTHDTDSAPSDGPNTGSGNSSNTHANTDQPASDASDDAHRSATGEAGEQA